MTVGEIISLVSKLIQNILDTYLLNFNTVFTCLQKTLNTLSLLAYQEFLRVSAHTWGKVHWQWCFQMQTAQGSGWALLVSCVSWRLSLWPAALLSRSLASLEAPALGGLLQRAPPIHSVPEYLPLLLSHPVTVLSFSFFSSSFWLSEKGEHPTCLSMYRIYVHVHIRKRNTKQKIISGC